MAEDVFRNIETGGGGERSRGYEGAEQPKQSWAEKLRKKLKRKHKSSEGQAEQPKQNVSFSEFFRGIFKDRESGEGGRRSVGERSQSWIDQAFEDSKANRAQQERAREERQAASQAEFSKLPEQEQTEFHMVVAQRFKDAGQRFIDFMTRRQTAETVHSSEATGEPRAASVEDEESSRVDGVYRFGPEHFTGSRFELHNVTDEIGPDIRAEGAANREHVIYDRSGPDIDPYIPEQHQPRQVEAGVETRNYRAKSRREALAGAVFGAYGLSWYERRQVDRKIKRAAKPLKKEIDATRKDNKELEDEVKRLQQRAKDASRVPAATPPRSSNSRIEGQSAPMALKPPEAVKELRFADLKPRIEALEQAKSSSPPTVRERIQDQIRTFEEPARKSPETSPPFAAFEQVRYEQEPQKMGMEYEDLPRRELEVARAEANLAGKERLREQHVEATEAARPNSYGGPVSVEDIIGARTQALSSSRGNGYDSSSNMYERVVNRYDPTNGDNTNAWIITVVILALIVLSILFAIL